jgi:hypothetical protein
MRASASSGEKIRTSTFGPSRERRPLSVDILDTFKSRLPTTKKNDVAVVPAVTAKF